MNMNLWIVFKVFCDYECISSYMNMMMTNGQRDIKDFNNFFLLKEKRLINKLLMIQIKDYIIIETTVSYLRYLDT